MKGVRVFELNREWFWVKETTRKVKHRGGFKLVGSAAKVHGPHKSRKEALVAILGAKK